MGDLIEVLVLGTVYHGRLGMTRTSCADVHALASLCAAARQRGLLVVSAAPETAGQIMWGEDARHHFE